MSHRLVNIQQQYDPALLRLQENEKDYNKSVLTTWVALVSDLACVQIKSASSDPIPQTHYDKTIPRDK